MLLIAGLAMFVAACGLAPGAVAGQCKTTPCTFFSNGQPLDGTCGARPGDTKECFCISDSNKKLAQAQSGCSANAAPAQ
jgi:hypothetical protein